MVEKENGSTVSDKRLLWDQTEIAEERNSSGGTVQKRYFSQGVQDNGTAYFYTRDHLGSIREATDGSQTLSARYDYDPYGKRTKVAGSGESDFGFTGHYYHAPSGLHLALYRAYSSEWGRWLSQDPLEESGGINLFEYSSSDPINRFDTYGLDVCIVISVGGGPVGFTDHTDIYVQQPDGTFLIGSARWGKVDQPKISKVLPKPDSSTRLYWLKTPPAWDKTMSDFINSKKSGEVVPYCAPYCSEVLSKAFGAPFKPTPWSASGLKDRLDYVSKPMVSVVSKNAPPCMVIK